MEIQSNQKSEGLDLFSALIKGASMTSKADQNNGQAVQKQTLSDSDIFGDAFVFMLAGHETIANALHFPLVLPHLTGIFRGVFKRILTKPSRASPSVNGTTMKTSPNCLPAWEQLS